MEKRLLQLPKNNSFLLFGPRGCGKTTLLNAIFDSKKTIWIDLLRPVTLDKYQTNPDLLIQRETQLDYYRRSSESPEAT